MMNKDSIRRPLLIGLLLLLVLFVVTAVSAHDDGGESDPPSPNETNQPIPAPWPEEPGAMPLLIDGRVPERALIFSSPSLQKSVETTAPAIDVWYGDSQKFGHLGNPQQWINIVGNVSGLGNNGSLSYRLNGGAAQALSTGIDGYRLEKAGDFNIEIDYTDLDPGDNGVVITAFDGVTETERTVTLNYTAGQSWPGNYDAVWDSSTDLQDVAQVVDGHWQRNGSSVIIDADSWGYDRLLAIGEESWTDYEVAVPFTVYGLDPSGYLGVSNGPGVGLILRWLGHFSQDSEQPRTGWSQLGAIGWYRWLTDRTEALELRGYDWRRGSDSSRVLQFGTTYWLKMSVQSVAGQPSYYRLKFWSASEDEPLDWNLQGYSSSTASNAGSLLLVAHHVDVAFGHVTIRDLNQLRLQVNLNQIGEGSLVIDPNQADFGYAERVNIYATAADGWEFAYWDSDYSGTASPADFRIYQDLDITATFVPINAVELTIQTEGDGDVVAAPSRPLYPWGEMVTLTAEPSPASAFSHWSGDLSGDQNPVNLLLDGNKNITAVFTPTVPTKAITLTLGTGWNMVSSAVNPSNTALDEVLDPIIDALVLVKDGNGDVFWPDLGINDIGEWDVLSGYQVYVETPTELVIQGMAVDPATAISLDPGWHLVPYLHETPLPAADALVSVTGQLTLAKDGWGNVYWPAYNVNSIGDLESGKGYQLLLHTGGTLSYPP